MPHNLLIRLKNSEKDSPRFEWLVIDDNGTFKTTEESDLLKYAETAQEIIVLAPSLETLITKVKLPKLSSARLAKAIPFALEDQITEDPGNLHFAVSTLRNEESIPIAVVHRETMNHWQSMIAAILQKSAAKVKVLLPDVLALPWQDGQFRILIDQDLAWVRTGRCSGFAIETKTLYPVLSLLLKQPGLSKPALIQVDNMTAADIFTPEEATALGIPIQISSTQTNPLSIMRGVVNEPVLLNLLQGSFAPVQKRITLDQLMWAGVVMVSAWLVLMTMADLTRYFLLHRVQTAIHTEMQTLYAHTYPHTPVPDNPKLVLQKELKTLRLSRSDSVFIHLLNKLEPGFASFANSGLSLKNLSYRKNQFSLTVEANDSAILDRLRQSLESQGLKVSVNHAERSANGFIETRLTVEEIS